MGRRRAQQSPQTPAVEFVGRAQQRPWPPAVECDGRAQQRPQPPAVECDGRAQQRPQPPAVDTDVARLVRGLFETPSGFAIFSFRNSILKEENAVEHIWARFVKDYMAKFLWLKQFLEFEDKSVAINRTTGLDKQLRDMLKIWTRPGETLVVGSLDHQKIIEADVELGVKCWYDACVMEMMWGMKNLICSLVPQEQKVLTKEERLPLSKGLQMILHRYNFDVKPEMASVIRNLSSVTWTCDDFPIFFSFAVS